MYQFKSSDSVAYKVRTVIKSHIESRGSAWLLNLGYGECNDYATNVAAMLQCRFETVTRYIRAEKARLRKAQPTK